MAYHSSVAFEWDETKSDRCLKERGFAFTYVLPAFADAGRRVVPDDRRDYAEARYRLYGRVDGRLFVIVYTLRRGVFRIISARRANARERKAHDDG